MDKLVYKLLYRNDRMNHTKLITKADSFDGAESVKKHHETISMVDEDHYYYIVVERAKEREFPKTSLPPDKLNEIYDDSLTNDEGMLAVANAVIKQYILDCEGGE